MLGRILGTLLLVTSLLQAGCLCCRPWGCHRCCKFPQADGGTPVARPLALTPPNLPKAF
jgi:hypothetical protein